MIDKDSAILFSTKMDKDQWGNKSTKEVKIIPFK